MSTGRLRSYGVVRKCSSSAWNPARRSWNPTGPIATIVERPIAESMEYRPPTQSQKPNMLSGSIPNLATSSAFVETATKCLAIAASMPSADSTHERAEWAFVIVSSVVNVFDDDDEERLLGGEVASRLDEVRGVHVRDEAERQVATGVVAKRLVRHHGPEVGAPDPDVHDVADRLPV